jgi:hypothetical protein
MGTMGAGYCSRVAVSKYFGATEMPDGFPVLELDSLHGRVVAATENDSPYRKGYMGGVNGIRYREITADRAARELTASLTVNLAPELPERVRQECLLFEFYTAAFSAIECSFFCLWHIGGVVNPRVFPIKDERAITVPGTRARYCATWASDEITSTATRVADSAELASSRASETSSATARAQVETSRWEILMTPSFGGWKNRSTLEWSSTRVDGKQWLS